MPSPLPGASGSVVKLAAVGNLFGQEIVATFAYRVTVAATGADPLQSLADDFYTNYAATLLTTQGSDFTLNSTECHLVVNPGDPAQRRDHFENTSGGATPPSNPPTVALSIRKRTAFVGRRYRGRLFLAAMPLAANDGGSLTTTFATLVQAQATAGMLGNFAATDPTMQVEPVLIGIDASNVGTYPVGKRVTPIVSVDIDLKYRSQRRREIGVGA